MVTATREYGRSAMHGIRMELLTAQAEALGLPLDIVWLSREGGGAEYEAAVRARLAAYREAGIGHVAFGDVHLEDVRAYREELDRSAGLASLFPLWGRPPAELARETARTFRAVVVCVDTDQLAGSFCGREYDEAFLRDLPPGCDPLGERGEFHTFCYDGPGFARRVAFRRGETVLRDGRFQYADLVPPA